MIRLAFLILIALPIYVILASLQHFAWARRFHNKFDSKVVRLLKKYRDRGTEETS